MQDDVRAHGVSRWGLHFFVQLVDSPITSRLLNFHLILTTTCRFCWHASHWTATPCFRVCWPWPSAPLTVSLNSLCSHTHAQVSPAPTRRALCSGLVAAFHQHVLSVPAGCAPLHCLIYSSYQIHIAKRVRRATFHLHAAALQIWSATLTRKMAAAMHANVWVCVRKCARVCFGVWETAELKDG